MSEEERLPLEKEALIEKLDEIRNKGLALLGKIDEEESLQNWRREHLGRKAEIVNIMRQMSSFPNELRPVVGKNANIVKKAFEKALEERIETVKKAALERSLSNEKLDVTLPGRTPTHGRIHPQTNAVREICNIFSEMGFQIYRSRDVETDEYNFELLNMPAHHPARDMWDTFYTDKDGVILRTHTSPGQIHAMRQVAPEPVRAILPGMCYRYEQITARSEIQFNQIELIAVGRDITFGDLKGTLQDFVNRLFGKKVRTRLRPNHFPFTEPSAEMDVECFICGGKGCPVCKKSGWLEILGCGMVHPTVLKNGGYDPEVFSGFAAGLGPERINMLRHKIEDIRYFWGNDIRFLEQF